MHAWRASLTAWAPRPLWACAAPGGQRRATFSRTSCKRGCISKSKRDDYKGWESRPDWDWQSPESSRLQDLDELIQEDEQLQEQSGGSLSRRLQDVVVLVLLCALGFGVANLAFKLLIVMWALIAAALRYTILGIILLVVLALWT